MAQFDPPQGYWDWYAFAQTAAVSQSAIVNKTASQFVFTGKDGTTVTLSGSGFTYSGNAPTGGKVTTASLAKNGSDFHFTYSAGLSLATLYDAAFKHGGLKLLNALLVGNDVMTDGAGSFDLMPTFGGNDTVAAGGGNDVVYGDAGNDTLQGGNGFDTLSYVLSFLDGSAKLGVEVDLVAGRVRDCWGNVDAVSGFEGVVGSKSADVINGSNNGKYQPTDLLAGLKGADVIDGRGGGDWVLYGDDARYGGMDGVVVDLSDGKAIDGFGTKDKLRNIENAEGTAKHDEFVGSGQDNGFNGLGGNDSFDGRGGRDTVYYDTGKQSLSADDDGMRVDLTRDDKQVTQDLYGDKDTLVSIERIVGSTGRDVMKGDGDDTTFLGYGGADKLTGGGGRDTFEYGYFMGVKEFGDTIADFTSGKDQFRFNLKSDLGAVLFPGMDAVVRFANAASPQQTRSSFFFDAAKEALFWDTDGADSKAAILVAHLPGVESMTASDIVIA